MTTSEVGGDGDGDGGCGEPVLWALIMAVVWKTLMMRGMELSYSEKWKSRREVYIQLANDQKRKENAAEMTPVWFCLIWSVKEADGRSGDLWWKAELPSAFFIPLKTQAEGKWKYEEQSFWTWNYEMRKIRSGILWKW